MKYKKMSEMKNDEIENLLEDMMKKYGVTKCNIIQVNKDEYYNTLSVKFEMKYTNGEIQKETAHLTSSYMEDEFNSGSKEEFYRYKQYMIAKGYSEYWKDNPYVEREVI